MRTTIQFTANQAAALLHRLELAEVFADVFSDTEGMEHLAGGAEETANNLARQLINNGCVTIETTSEQDREVLIEAIAGSTWVAVHDTADVSRQKQAAVRRSLQSAAATIEATFRLDAGHIAIPEA